MENLNAFQMVSEIDNAKGQLPVEYEPVDDVFLDKYNGPIQTLKNIFENKGGVHHAEVEGYSILFRVPSQKQYSNIRKRGEKLDGFETDLMLLGECLLYPRMDIVQQWISCGKFGLVTAFTLAIIKETKMYQEASVKKL